MKKNPTKHRLLRYSLYVVAAIVVLVVAAIVFALLPPGQKLIKGELESFISSRLDQKMTIGSFATNLFSHASLSDIRVRSKAGSDSTTIALVDNFFIDYSLWPLVHKEFAIKSILIDTVRVRLKRDTSGFFNLIVLDTMPTKSTFTVTLGSILLQSFSLEYRDRMTPLTGSLERMNVVAESVDSLQGYAFSIATDSGSLKYDTLPAEPISLDLRGLYSPDVWLLDTLLVRLGGLQMAGYARLAKVNDEAPIDADLSVQGDPRTAFNVVAAQYGITDVEVKGDLQSHITLSGTTAAPRGKALLNLPTVTVHGVEAISGSASVRLGEDSLLVDSVDISIFDGHLSASGYMALDSLKADAVIALTGIDLASIWKTFGSGPSPYKGSLQANVTVGGYGRDLDRWKADGSLEIKQAQYRNESLADLNADFSLNKGILTTSLSQEYIKLSAKVDLNQDTVAGHVGLAVSDLSPLAGIVGQPTLAGAIDADINLSGSRERPRLQASVIGNGIKYRDFPVDTVNLEVDYADTTILVRQLLFSGEFKAAEAAAAPFALSSLEGNYRYTGRASGPLDRLQGKLTVSAYHPGYGSVSFDSATVGLYVDLPVIRLDTFDLYKNAVAVRSRARFNLDSARGELTAQLYDKSAKHDGADTAALGLIHASLVRTTTDTLEIDARASEIDLAAFRTLWPDTIDIAGTLALNTQFTLAGTVPRGELSMTVTDPRYEDIKLDSATTRVSVSSDSLEITTLDLYSSDQQLTANAYFALSTTAGGSPTITRSSAVSGSIHGSGLRLKGVEPFLPGDFSLEGTSSLDLKWQGTINDPNLRGSIDLRDVSLISSEDSILSSFNLAASVTDSVIAFDTAAGETYGTPFTLDGSATLKSLSEVQTDLTMTVADVATITAKGRASRKNIDLTAVVDSLNLDVLMPFVPDVDTLSGELNANLTVKGDPGAPNVTGFVKIDKGLAKSKAIDQQISDAVARITFTRDTVHIDTLSAEVGAGALSLTGTLAHSGMTITDIKTTATAHNIKISDPGLFSATIDSADLKYGSKDKDRYLLTGTVALGEAKLTKNFDYASILPWANKVKQVTPNVPAPLDRTDFDLKILGGDSLWVDNNLARMRLSADVTFIGSVSRPNLTGRVLVEKGYVLYLDRKFNVQEGVLYFSDPNKINPDINFLAQANITTYQASQPMSYVISVSVSGNLDNPVINLSSEPPLSQSDIFSLLTFGATVNQLSGQGGSSTTEQVLLNRAATLGSEQLSSVVTSKLGSLFGFDQFTVQGNLFGGGSAAGPSLLVAKQVTSRIRVTYSTTVGQVNDQNIRLDYQLTNRFSLESETDQRGEASISLKYGFRFK